MGARPHIALKKQSRCLPLLALVKVLLCVGIFFNSSQIRTLIVIYFSGTEMQKIATKNHALLEYHVISRGGVVVLLSESRDTSGWVGGSKN